MLNSNLLKKKNSVWRGFVIISLMLITKRKTERLIFLYNIFSKKKKRKGRARLLMFCLVFGQLPELGKTFVPLRFTEHALLVTPRANMNESSPSTLQRKFIIVLIISNWTWYTILPRIYIYSQNIQIAPSILRAQERKRSNHSTYLVLRSPTVGRQP